MRIANRMFNTLAESDNYNAHSDAMDNAFFNGVTYSQMHSRMTFTGIDWISA